MANLSNMSNEELLQILQESKANNVRRWMNAVDQIGFKSGPSDLEQLAQETGPFKAAAIGAGKTVNDVWSGVKQLALEGVGKVAPELVKGKLEGLAQDQADKKAIYAPLQSEHPIATGIGEATPYVAIPPSAGLLGSSLMVGGMEGLKYGTPEERAKRAAIGAGTTAAGGLAGKLVGKMIAPVESGTLSQTQRDALAAALDMGITPRRSQLTQSPMAAQIEDWAARTPGGSGVMREFANQNQAAINKTAAKSIWQNADELSPAVFSQARTDIGVPFEAIKSLPGRVIKVDKNVGSAADAVLAVQGKLPKQMQSAEVIALAQQAKQASGLNSRIDGEAYQLIRSRLTDSANSAFEAKDSVAGKAYQGLLSALDNSAENSLKSIGQGELADALRAARPAYANLKTLERGLVAEGGNVSPQRLAQALRSSNEQAFREGARGELFDIGRFGESFKPLQQGSQTYDRTLLSNPISTAVGAPFAFAAAKANTSPIINAYARELALNPTAASVAGGAAQIANPVTRALAAELLKRQTPLIGVPVMAEQ